MTYREAMQAARRQFLEQKLREAGENITEAARLAGLNRTHFYKLARDSGIVTRHKLRGNWEAPIPADW